MIAIAAVAWLFSMWISNTATTAMMVPIAIGLSTTIRRFCPDDEDAQRRMGRYAEGLLITLAYASSLGGTATPIGTAPALSLAPRTRFMPSRSLFVAATFCSPVR